MYIYSESDIIIASSCVDITII